MEIWNQIAHGHHANKYKNSFAKSSISCTTQIASRQKFNTNTESNTNAWPQIPSHLSWTALSSSMLYPMQVALLLERSHTKNLDWYQKYIKAANHPSMIISSRTMDNYDMVQTQFLNSTSPTIKIICFQPNLYRSWWSNSFKKYDHKTWYKHRSWSEHLCQTPLVFLLPVSYQSSNDQ